MHNLPDDTHLTDNERRVIILAVTCSGDDKVNTKDIIKARSSHEDLILASEAMIKALENCPGEFNYPVLIEIELRDAIDKAKRF